MINRTSDEIKRRIQRKTVYALPNRPSERGYKAEDIKKALYSPILDTEDSVFSEIDRIVEEANANLHQVDAKIKENSAYVYTYNIPAAEWHRTDSISPYLYSAEMVFPAGELDADAEVTLIIDPITASTYGIVIGSIQGDAIVFYAMHKPNGLVSFDVQIQGIRVEERMDLSVPQLIAPVVSARGTVISITDSHLQLQESEAYKIYVDNAFYIMLNKSDACTLIDLGGLVNGRHVVEVCSVASEYNDSPRSNSVEIWCGPSNEIDVVATPSVTITIVGVEIDVDWGDGLCEHLTATTTHNYEQESTYTLKINGKIGVVEYDEEGNKAKYVIIEQNLVKEVRINGDWRDIASSAFIGCQHLESITFNEEMTSIPENVCSGTTLSYVYIPSKVASIGEGAFWDCAHLQWVRVGMGSDLVAIGDNAFHNCIRLVDISCSAGASSGNSNFAFDGLSKLYSIGHHSFANTGITNLRIQSTVHAIGGQAFYDCDGLVSVVFERDVESLGSAIFAFCSNLTSVTLPDNHFLEDGQFYGGGFKIIASHMFYGCNSLTEIRLPSSIEEIKSRGLAVEFLVVRYNGTRREWENVTLYTAIAGIGNWDWNSTVICTDD